METAVDLSTLESLLLGCYETGQRIESLLSQNTELILHIYTGFLWGIGVCGAILVCLVLYKFLRKFF